MFNGAPVPRRGSFKAKVLEELDQRERSLRSTEMFIICSFLDDIAELLVMTLPYKQELRDLIQSTRRTQARKLMRQYDPELYQDRYLPEYDRLQQENSRREKEEALAKAEAEARDRDFVEKLT